MGEKIFARQLGNVNTWTILKEMMKMIMMRMGCIIMTESEQEFVCFVAEDRRTDGQMEERRIKHSDDITGIGIEMGWDLREDESPQDACSIITRCM